MRRSPATTVAIVALLVTSMVAVPLGAGIATADPVAQTTGDLSAHSPIPEDNVRVDRDGSTSLGPGSVSSWDLSASRHAETLEVEVLLVDGELSELALSDDTNHAGREVAVDATALATALPDVSSVSDLPDRVWGLHETEGRWSRELVVEDGIAFVEIPYFSTNRVSFVSRYTIDGQPAEDGSEFTYDVGDIDSVSDFSVGVSGVTTTKDDAFDATAVNGDSVGYAVGGNSEPTNETLTLTGVETTTEESSSLGEMFNGDAQVLEVGGNQPAIGEGVTLTGTETTSSRITFSDSVRGNDNDYVDVGGNLDAVGPSSGSPRLRVYRKQLQERSKNVNARVEYHWKTASGTINGGTGNLDYVKFHYSWGISGSDKKIFDAKIKGPVSTTISERTNSGGSDVVTVNGNGKSVSGDQKYTLEPTGWHSNFNHVTIDKITVKVDGYQPISHTLTSNGQSINIDSTGSYAVPLSPGNNKLRFRGSGGFDYNLKYNEVTSTKNPTIQVGNESVSHSGVLRGGETVNLSGGDLSPGNNSVSVSTDGGSSVIVDPSWDAVTATEDPSVSIGSSTVDHDGILLPGETVTESVNLSTGVSSADVTTTGEVDLSGSWTERTRTTNPTVSVNGVSDTYQGVLDDGETVSLTIPETAIQSGENNVTIGVESPSIGPIGMTELDYAHTAEITESVEYAGNSFDERYEVSKTWTDTTEDATATLPFSSDNIVGVGSVEVTHESPNGIQTVTEPSYSWDAPNNSVVVPLGDVEAGDTTTVSARARKIDVTKGKITVVNPSSESGVLNSEVRIDETGPNGDVVLDVSGIRQTKKSERLPYVSSTSWIDPETPVRLEPGQVEIIVENGEVGEQFTVSTGDLGVRAINGDAFVEVIDPEEPRFRLLPGESVGDVVEVTYYPAKTGSIYELFRASDEIVVDTKEASSPVRLRTSDNSGVFLVRLSEEIRGVALGAASGVGGGGGLLPPWLLLLLGVVGSIGALAYLSRRLDRGSSGTSSGASSLTLIVGGAAVVIVAVELVTPFSLVGTLVSDVLSVGVRSLGGSFGALLGTIAILVGLVILQTRTEVEIPLPVLGAGGILSVVWLFESLSPGSVTEPLASALDEVGPAVIILGMLSIVALLWLWLRSRRPQIVIGGGSS